MTQLRAISYRIFTFPGLRKATFLALLTPSMLNMNASVTTTILEYLAKETIYSADPCQANDSCQRSVHSVGVVIVSTESVHKPG